MKTRTICIVFLMLVTGLSLLMSGCGQNTIVTSVQVAVTAIEAVLPLLPGVPAGVLTYSDKWLSGASGAITSVLEEIDSTDAASVQAAKIASLLSQYASVNLPAGTPQELAAALQAAASAIAGILEAVPAQNKLAAAPGTKTGKLLSVADTERLLGLKSRLVAVRVKLNGTAEKK